MNIRHQLAVALVAGLVAFFHLGQAGLFDEDEPKNAACAQEMLARGDWIVPTFNYELRTDKPILLYWLMLAAYRLLGVNEFSARVPSALCTVGTALVVYQLGKRLYRPTVGLWAAIILCTSMMYDVVARAATPDATFIFCCTLSLLAYVRSAPAWRLDRSQVAVPAWEDYLPGSWMAAVPMYAAMGLGTLAKGPAAIVLPGGSIGLFLLVVGRAGLKLDATTWKERGREAWSWLRSTFGARNLLRALRGMRPLAGILVVAVVALPWYITVGIQTDGAWPAGFLGTHNLGRFARAMEGHRGPFFYYLIAICIGFFPWSVFLGATIWRIASQLRWGEQRIANDLFVACWAVFCVGLFSLAGTKLPNYVLPAYPALALATAAAVVDWMMVPAAINRRQAELAFWTLAGVGVAALVGFPIAAYFVLPGQWHLGLAGLVPMAGGLAGLRLLRRAAVGAAMHIFAATAIVQSAVIFGIAAVNLSQHQTSKSLIAAARRDAGRNASFAVFDYFEPSLVFYAGRRVDRFDCPGQVRQFFESNGHPYLITHEKFLGQIEPALPRDVKVLARKRRFLRQGDVVVLARSPALVRRTGSSSGRQ